MDATLKKAVLSCLFLIALFVPGVISGEYCSYLTYCEDGYYCCEYDTKCCSKNTLTVGAIIGIVIGCLVFFGCCMTVICCLTKQGHRKGHAIQPVQSTGVAIITTGHQGPPGYSQAGYGQSQMYGQHPMYGQPMYGQQSMYGQPQMYGLLGTNRSTFDEKAGTSDPAYPLPPPNF